MSDVPECRYCKKPMSINTAVSTPTFTQYVCACQGFIYFVNVPMWKPPLELRKAHR